MAYVFSGVPFMRHLMGYWYHFAIMFEAVFILTAVDTGTRVGRFYLQEMIGKVIPKVGEVHWMPGIILTSLLFTGAWGYLVFTGDIGTIWPLFGISNQLLASSGLIIATSMLIRLGKAKYAWATGVPGVLMAFVTLYAGYLNIVGNYLPKKLYLLVVLSIAIMSLVVIVLAATVRRWVVLLAAKEPVQLPDDTPVLRPAPIHTTGVTVKTLGHTARA
jgi:carbon starvation protein